MYIHLAASFVREPTKVDREGWIGPQSLGRVVGSSSLMLWILSCSWHVSDLKNRVWREREVGWGKWRPGFNTQLSQL